MATSRATFDRQIQVNPSATLDPLRLLSGTAECGRGRVVTIDSVQQEEPDARLLVYAGSKAMQFNWALNLARQFGGRGITVNNLAPGAIAAARNRDQLAVERGPVGRFGRPDDLL